jgi:hypothetical protein
MSILDKVEVTKSNELTTEKSGLDNKKVVESLDIPFEPCDSMVLIKPLPEIKVEKEFTEYDKEANEGRDTTVDGEEAIMKTEVREVSANMQKGVVLAIDKAGLNPLGYEIGDIIVYPLNAGTDFDLYRDSKLLRSFEVKGKWLGK